MEMFFFRHAEYERLYNCTGLDIDSVPLEHRQRQFVPESIIICVLCAIYYVLYVPCMYSIWKHSHDNSCYKLLLFIGITDLANLWILGFFSGWLNLRGDVFCSHPTLIYLMGVAVLSLWVAESSADLVLAFNRCLDLGSPRFSRILFSGRRTSLWLFACFLNALYWASFTKPVVYSSVFFGWFFYPFVGYRTDDKHEFEVRLHTVHDIMVAVLSPIIYLIFATKLFLDIRNKRQQFGVFVSELSAAQKRSFLQVFLISLLNTTGCSIYVYMQYTEVFRQSFISHLIKRCAAMPHVIYEIVRTPPYWAHRRRYHTTTKRNFSESDFCCERKKLQQLTVKSR